MSRVRIRHAAHISNHTHFRITHFCNSTFWYHTQFYITHLNITHILIWMRHVSCMNAARRTYFNITYSNVWMFSRVAIIICCRWWYMWCWNMMYMWCWNMMSTSHIQIYYHLQHMIIATRLNTSRPIFKYMITKYSNILKYRHDMFFRILTYHAFLTSSYIITLYLNKYDRTVFEYITTRSIEMCGVISLYLQHAWCLATRMQWL